MIEKNQSKSKPTARGGKRANAGRKAGTANKKTREIANKAAEAGITPLEVMLDTMREIHAKAMSIDAGEPVVVNEEAITRLGLLTEASKIARDAAPYMHARLQAMELSGKGGTPLNPPTQIVMTGSELEKIAKRLADEV
jgi:hypothetical protein